MNTVLQTRDRFLDALRKGDADALDNLLDEKFTFVDAGAKILIWRDALLDLMRRGDLRFERIAVVSESVKESADQATLEQDLNLAGTLRGHQYDGAYRITEFYRKSADGWKVLLSGARAK